MPRLRALLARRPLVVVGLASYSIYLVHEPVIAYFDAAGIPFVISGIGGLVAGLGFWYFGERFLMKPENRKRFVNWTRSWIERALFAPMFKRKREDEQALLIDAS